MAKHTEHVHVLMDKATRQALEALAAKDGITASEVVRRLIQRSARARVAG